MTDEALFHRGTIFVRRLRLAPGEVMPLLSNIVTGVESVASRLQPDKLIGTSRPKPHSPRCQCWGASL